MKPLALLCWPLLFAGCVFSSHATRPAALGTPRSSADLLDIIDLPGPLRVETLASCDWEVDRKGLINLDHPKSKEAGITDGPEPIRVFFHVLRHPTFGTFLIDTGVERALRDAPNKAAVRGLVARVMKAEKLKFRTPLGDWLAKEKAPLAGVFLTHLHLDHVMGMPDVPAATPVFTGPGETRSRAVLNGVVAPNIDRALEGKGALQEWQFTPDPAGRFRGVLDVFGDGSLWALHLPGHTEGTTAYLARTPNGPVLFTGDVSHTRWGWDHGVEPGAFSSDLPRSAESFAALQRLVAEHPRIDVRLGHQ